MTQTDKKHALREQLALISTEAYLMMRSDNECERIERYNMVQEQISAILSVMDDSKSECAAPFERVYVS